MSRGAKITLVVFVFILVVAGLSIGSWFIFKNDRAMAAKSYLDLGDKYLNDKNYSQALIAYKKAAILTPRSFAPYLKQGILAKETGHLEEAVNFISYSIQFGPQELSSYLVLGETYLLKNDLGNAKCAFERAKKIAPKNDNISFLLFETALKDNDLEAAERNLTEAEKNNDLPKYKICQALLESFDDPSKSLSIIADIDSSNGINGLTLADFSNLFQKLNETKNDASKKVMIFSAFSQVGEIYFGTKGLEGVTQENPKMRDAWVFLSYSYLLGNEPDKAKEVINKAIELDPVYPATYYLLSKYWEEKNNTVASEEALNHAKELGFDENNPLKS